MEPIALRPIGVIRSPFATAFDAPRQGFLTERESRIEVFPEYQPALAGLERHEKLLVVFWAHGADRDRLRYASGEGVFFGRSPHRPNPILLTEVDVLGIEGGVLRVKGLDAVDGSPLLDLKPTVAEWEGPGGYIGNWEPGLTF